jgi:Flp pilus assembly protein TadG
MVHHSPSCRPGNPSPRSRPRTGATALEFALVGPVFLFLVLGAIEIGRGLMVQHLLTNAARDGARVAIIEGKGTSDVQSAVDTALSGLGISSYSVSTSPDPSTASANTAITVTISVAVSDVSWLPVPQFLNGTIYGQYTLPRE